MVKIAPIILAVTIAVAGVAEADDELEPGFEHWYYHSGTAGHFGREARSGVAAALRVAVSVIEAGHPCDSVSQLDELAYLGPGVFTLYCNRRAHIYELDPITTRAGTLTGEWSIRKIK